MTQVAYSPYAFKAPAPPAPTPSMSPPPDPKMPPRPDAVMAPQIWKDTFQAPATERLIADFHCSMLDYKNGVFEAHVFISVNYVAIKPINPPTAQKKLQHFIIGMGQIASWSRASKILTDQPPYVKIKTVKPGQLADSIHIYGTDLRLHLLFDFVQMSYEKFCYAFDTAWRTSPAGAAAAAQAAASLAASMRAINNPPAFNNAPSYGLNLTGGAGMTGMGLAGTGMFNPYPGRPMGMPGMPMMQPMQQMQYRPLNSTSMPGFGGMGSPFAGLHSPLMMPPPTGSAPMMPPTTPPPMLGMLSPQTSQQQLMSSQQQQFMQQQQQQQQQFEQQQQAVAAAAAQKAHSPPPQRGAQQYQPPQQQQQQQTEIVAECESTGTPMSASAAIEAAEANGGQMADSGFKMMQEAATSEKKSATSAEDEALLQGCKILTDWTEMPLTVTPTKLTFNLGSRQAPVDQEVMEQVQVTNNGKDKATFKFIPKNSTKYTLTADPAEGKVPAGKAMVVTLKMTVLCTAQIRLELPFVCWKGSKLTDKTAKFMCPLTGEIESQLTTKLDIDELTLFTPYIGDGSFGTVYKGEYRGLEVAIKVLKTQNPPSPQLLADFQGEVSMMEKLRHPCIINFIGAVHTPGKLAMVTEFCPYGNLGSAVVKEKASFTYGLKLKSLLDTARGMDFLHRSNILHRDLKPDNILMVSLEVRASVICKISDFGTTRDVNRFASELHFTKGVGTPIFMAPEILEGKSYEKSADVYSFGIMMANVALEALPFENDPEIKSSWQFASLVVNGKRPKLPANIPPEFATLCTSCWVKAERDRPSFADIVQKLEMMFKKELHATKRP